MTRLPVRYTSTMGSKLMTTNPYLRNPAIRKRMIFMSVASSSAIEGIRAPFIALAAKHGIRKPRVTQRPHKKSDAHSK